MGEAELERLREKLAEITGAILKLAAERRRLSLEIGKLKASMGKRLLDRETERRLLKEALRACQEQELPEETCRRLLTILIEDSLNAQRTVLSVRKRDALAYRRVFARAAELQKMGRKVIRMEIGQPDFGAPESVVEAAYKAMKEGYAKYSTGAGIMELRSALAQRLGERYGVDLKPENIVVTTGGSMAVYATMESLTRPGDEVVVIEPAWPLYGRQAEQYGRRVVRVGAKLEDGWSPIKALEGALSDTTRLIFINYPNNPTGKVLSRKEFGKVLEMAREVGAWVASDEVYMDYVFEGEEVSALQFPDSHSVVMGSFSKSWGMTGYRIGFIAAEEEIAKRAALVQNIIVTCVPEFIQRAALAALQDLDAAKRNSDVVRRRLVALAEELARSKLMEFVRPQGAMYVFPRIKLDGFDSTEFCFKLLEEKGVGVAPGTSFGEGYSNHIRISAVRPEEELREGARKLIEAVEEEAERAQKT